MGDHADDYKLLVAGRMSKEEFDKLHPQYTAQIYQPVATIPLSTALGGGFESYNPEVVTEVQKKIDEAPAEPKGQESKSSRRNDGSGDGVPAANNIPNKPKPPRYPFQK